MSVREVSVEKHFVDEVKRRGGWAVKGCKVAGFPDRIVLAKPGRIAFVELKNDVGVVSPIQKVVHRKMLRLGFPIRIIYTRTGVDNFIESFFQHGGPQGVED